MILGIDASQANRKIRSGTEWYAFYLMEEFKKLAAGRSDIRVRLYTRDALQSDLANNLPDNFEVKILRWPLKYFWGQVRLSLEMLFNPPDILFCPAHTIPLVHPKKTFTTLHDVGFEDHPELYDRLSLWYHRWSAKFAVRKAHHIFTVSEFSKQRIVANYNCPENKITVTHLGIVSQFTIVNRVTILKKNGLEEKKYLLFVGRIEPKKNILNIIRAFEMSGVDMPLVLAGRKLMNLSPHSNIKLLNYISEEDKWALYQGATVFIFPTLYEGFGLPILEAQASGIPVITSNTASNPEVAGDGAVIVNPKDPQEIARAIKSLLTDKELREEKIKSGLENIEKFSWAETARKTLAAMIDDEKDLR